MGDPQPSTSRAGTWRRSSWGFSFCVEMPVIAAPRLVETSAILAGFFVVSHRFDDGLGSGGRVLCRLGRGGIEQ